MPAESIPKGTDARCCFTTVNNGTDDCGPYFTKSMYYEQGKIDDETKTSGKYRKMRNFFFETFFLVIFS